MTQTDQTVSGNTTDTYDSGTMVCFENGMEVSIGANMEAMIDGCGNQ